MNKHSSQLSQEEKKNILYGYIKKKERILVTKVCGLSALVIAVLSAASVAVRELQEPNKDALLVDTPHYPATDRERKIQHRIWIGYAKEAFEQSGLEEAKSIYQSLKADTYTSRVDFPETSGGEVTHPRIFSENPSAHIPFASYPDPVENALIIDAHSMVSHEESNKNNALVIQEYNVKNSIFQGALLLWEEHELFLMNKNDNQSKFAKVYAAEFSLRLMTALYGQVYSDLAHKVSETFTYTLYSENGESGVKYRIDHIEGIENQLQHMCQCEYTREVKREFMYRINAHAALIAAKRQLHDAKSIAFTYSGVRDDLRSQIASY